MQVLKIFALGGLDEHGRNMYIVEIDNDIFVIEAGCKYPIENSLGIGYSIQDFSYLIENKDRVQAIIITHAKDEVMLSLVHLLKEFKAPIYTSKYTARVIKNLLDQHDIYDYKLVANNRDASFKINNHEISFFPLVASSPDSFGVSLDTKYGQVVIISEYLIDYNIIQDCFKMDMNMFLEMSNRKIFALLSPSIFTSNTGYTAPRHRIYERIEKHFLKDTRIIVSIYSQNIFRILEVIELCQKYNKRVFFHNKQEYKYIRSLIDLGYLKCNLDMFASDKAFENKDEDVVCIVSAHGYRIFQLLDSIATFADPIIKPRTSDTFIIASPVTSDTAKYSSLMEDDLFKADVNIDILKSKDVLPLQASNEDIKTMLYIMKPKYYIPIVGDYKDLANNAEIAYEIGYKPDRIIVLDNGQVATFKDDKLVSSKQEIDINETYIEDLTNHSVNSNVLQDRETLSTDGVIIAGIILDFDTKKIIGGPDIQTRGVIYLKNADNIVENIEKILIETIEESVKLNDYDNIKIRAAIKDRISVYITKETGKKPIILPAIIEIRQKG